MPVASDNPVTYEGVELGRHLFYDPILSLDSSFSCASCHKQEVAFSDAPNRLSIGVNGDTLKRNTMPLFNLAWYPSMFWDGRSVSIEEQVFHPVRAHEEMDFNWLEATKRVKRSPFYQKKFKAAFGDQNVDSILIAKAIAQFERSLLSYNSKYDSVLRKEASFTPEEYGGFILANDQTMAGCLNCHTTDGNALGTIASFSNNGLDSIYQAEDYIDKGRGGVTGLKEDYGKFKIPSLRNVAVTAPYMHDGRFQTLEEVVDFYSDGVNESYNLDVNMTEAHKGGVRLNANEKKMIVAFLKTLTDSVFLTDQRHSNPFDQK